MKSSGFLLTLFMVFQLQAQAFEFESSEGNQVYNHRILMDDSYIIETIYQSNPPLFVLTRGGYYQRQGKRYLLPWNLIPTLKRINSKLFNGIVPVGKQKEKASGVGW